MFADKENMVKILIDSNAEMINVRNVKGETPLILAVENNGNNFHLKFSCDFCSFLFVYKNTGTESLIKYLIKKGADVNANDKHEQTLLHWSAENGEHTAC